MGAKVYLKRDHSIVISDSESSKVEASQSNGLMRYGSVYAVESDFLHSPLMLSVLSDGVESAKAIADNCLKASGYSAAGSKWAVGEDGFLHRECVEGGRVVRQRIVRLNVFSRTDEGVKAERDKVREFWIQNKDFTIADMLKMFPLETHDTLKRIDPRGRAKAFPRDMTYEECFKEAQDQVNETYSRFREDTGKINMSWKDYEQYRKMGYLTESPLRDWQAHPRRALEEWERTHQASE